MRDTPTFATDRTARRGLRALVPRSASSSATCRRTTPWAATPMLISMPMSLPMPLPTSPPPTVARPDAGQPPAAAAFQGPRLVVIDLRGRTKLITLQAARTTLGRDEHSTVVLHSPLASRRHAMLLCEGHTVVLRDLGSANGSFVNGQRVLQRTLRHGDVLTLGEDCVRFLAPALAERVPQTLDLLESAPAELALRRR